MTKYDKIVGESLLALRNNLKSERIIYNDILGEIQAEAVAATVNGLRPDYTDAFVDKVLRKYQKKVQEQIDTCPQDEAHAETLAGYKRKMTIVKKYAPQVINNPNDIVNLLLEWRDSGIDIKNKRVVMPMLSEANVDMRLANAILGKM